jgi:AbiV family abortive infection protein
MPGQIASRTFRKAASASFENANQLYEEAQLLADNGYMSRAAALAVIGLEEFAKAVAYAVAAIFPDKSQGIRSRLLKHEVKHCIADTFEGAQIVTDDWPLIAFQETGYWPAPEEVLKGIFVELANVGLSGLVPKSSDAKAHRNKMKSENKEFIPTPFIKDAAFYVDISETGEVLLPRRVDLFAESEISGLKWFLDHARPLLEILSDDSKWNKFAEYVRVSATKP